MRVKFSVEHAAVFQNYRRSPDYNTRGGCIEVLCDLMVATFILDTPEAVATFGGLCRFWWRHDSKNGGTDAGCILCQAPTSKYDCGAEELSSLERSLRTAWQSEAIRRSGDKNKMHQSGKLDSLPNVVCGMQVCWWRLAFTGTAQTK